MGINLIKESDELLKIHKLIWGFVPFQTLLLSIQKDLFEYIEKNKSLNISEICQEMDWKPRPTISLLNILKHYDLVIFYKRSRWALSRQSKKWFLKSSPNYLGDFILRTSTLLDSYKNLNGVLKNDLPDKEMYIKTANSFGQDQVETNSFVLSMNAMSVDFSFLVSNLINCKEICNMLDVGCGSGIISIEIMKKCKNIKCDFIDLPGVTNISNNFIKLNKVKNRSKVISSDWKKILPIIKYKYDLILLSQILHEENEKSAELLINCAIDLLKVDGILLIIGFIGGVNELIDDIAYIFDLNMKVELGSFNPNIEWINNITALKNVSCVNINYLSGGRILWYGRKNK